MFLESRVMTIGGDFQTLVVEVYGQPVKLSIWDIAGLERFGSFRGGFYRGAQAEARAKSKNFPYLKTSALSEVGVKEFLARWADWLTRVHCRASWPATSANPLGDKPPV